MAQAQLLIQTLKQLLKSQNLTYKLVAKHLDLSEASVKRLFAAEQLSLDRIESICELLGIEITDLLQQMQKSAKRISQLTWDQEKTIVSDRKLCLVTICVVNRWTFDEIINYYKITEHECIHYLAELDKIKFIELLPKNKYKLLISRRFSWIAGGPIQQFFQQYILQDFTGSTFKNENEEMICQFGMLTNASNELFRKKLRALADEFIALSDQDTSESLHKRNGSACILMIRPWAPTIFNEFIKN